MAKVLFVCLHNAGRSQMSEALLKRAVAGRHEAASAGTTPGEHVHPEVAETMGELGIDLADVREIRDEIGRRLLRRGWSRPSWSRGTPPGRRARARARCRKP